MQTKPIILSPDDEITQRLSQKKPVIVEADGVRYRLVRERPGVNLTDEPFADYDVEKVRAGLKASAGAFRGIDSEALKRDIREAREQDTMGRPA